jgi:DnaK suppressor protein
MGSDKTMFFRELLQQKISELLNDQMKTISVMSGDNERITDLNDQASMEVERNHELRIRDRERRLIFKMKEAIKRIDDGTFGICVDCGEEISEKRLIARPVTTQCIDCKTREEKNEKLFGKKGGRVIQYSFQGTSQSQYDDY